MPHNTPRSLPSPPSPAAYASTIFSRTPTLYYATYAFAYSASPHILPRTPPHIFCHVRPPPYILPRTPPLSRISCRPPKTKKRPCIALQGRFSICLSKACTRSRGRTGTGVNLLVFETSASTDSAIRADFVKIDCKCNHIFPFGKKSGQKNHEPTAYHIEYAHICVQRIPFPPHDKSPRKQPFRHPRPPSSANTASAQNAFANNRFSIGLRNCPKSQLPHKTPNKHPVPLPHQP